MANPQRATYPAAAPAAQANLQSVLRDDLRDGVAALGLELGTDQQEGLLAFIDLLSRWNRVYNLTSVRSPLDMLAVHLLDSLAMTDLIRSLARGSVLDVGTGPGLPGVPLAIALPHLRFDLVDAVAKKIGFVQQVKGALKLDNVTAHHQRVEALTFAKMPSVIISRAYANLGSMLRSVDRLVMPETTVVAMKGALPTDEIAAIPDAWRVVEVRPVDVPLLGAQRCAILLQRHGPASGR